MFVKTPLMKRTQGVMVDWSGWLMYWSVVCFGVICCESVSVMTICGSPTPCCMLLYPWDSLGLIWSTPISEISLWVGHLTVVVLPVRFWAFWLSIAYNLMLPFLCDSSIIASLKVGSVLFEITFSMCICQYDWGNFYFIQPHKPKSHPLMSTPLLTLWAFS